MPEDSTTLVLGVDLGGTKILTAVIDPQGKMLSRDHSVTPARKGREAVVESILESTHRALARANISVGSLTAVGIGAPGLVDPVAGMVLTSPHLPGWRNVPLRDLVEERLGKQAFLINDANAAALGELHFGAARGARNFIYVTVSTGIGGGIVIDGELYSGATGAAGEVGHMTIDDTGPPCNCGNRGCWETLASGTALAREARQRIEAGDRTSILEYAGGDTAKVTAQAIHSAAIKGDRLARELITRTGYYIGVGLANLINIFNPELIVIGGGLSNIGDILLQPAFKVAGERAYRETFSAVRFASAGLGRDSGVLGAAAFALRAMRQLPCEQGDETELL
ncbi:MAG: ROK family protein [Dehalococcoidia bacterium]|nr:ROK family protein [Dehalococcoidia bacterium]